GTSRIIATVADQQASVAATVTDFDVARPIHFENDVLPILSRFGCNAGGCHGKAEGQNGFKLSVYAFDPRADFAALTRESRGRRVFLAAPEMSLVLRKAAGDVPHGGGIRIRRDSPEYQTLRDWIASGAPLGDDDAPRVAAIRVEPSERPLRVGGLQRLRVIARFGDGRETDVTARSRFQSNNEGLASVDEHGLIQVGETPGQAAVMASYMGKVGVFQALIPRPGKIDAYPKLPEKNFIDRLANQKLRKLNIIPSPPVDDAGYLRRVYVDLLGTLPTSDEAREFLADDHPDRRGRLVEQLLKRPEYADYWALKWADLLRVDRLVLGHKGAYAYYRWIHGSFAANKPLDQFARELLLAEGPLREQPAGRFYQVLKRPGDKANAVAQVFLGVRIACAECHHHPFDRWSQTDYQGMRAFFAPVKQKKTRLGESLLVEGAFTAKHPRNGKTILAHALGTPSPQTTPPGDRRLALADWMTDKDNPWFARNLANRAWAHFLGRGLVEPVDDVRETNPPSNPELLDALARHLTDRGYDPRSLIRVILASET
ncbi:MAG: DUF1549 and DUF1553 domain-containing protein, partial [Planctomycetales bacterium]